ncbi:hypothetical protein M8J75_002312 [Diaphorina citri]|nr:hypothetical protein M8J75_002312 [Diaphorina citri]
MILNQILKQVTLNPPEQPLPELASFLETLQKQTEQRLMPMEMNELLQEATFLDPRFKTSAFIREQMKNDVKNKIIRKGTVILRSQPNITPQQPQLSSSSSAAAHVPTTVVPSAHVVESEDSIWNDWDAAVENEISTPPQDNSSKIIIEVDRYLKEQIIRRIEELVGPRTVYHHTGFLYNKKGRYYYCTKKPRSTEVLATGNTPPTFTPGRPGGPESGPIPERTTTSCSASRHSPLSIRYGCYPSISATEVLASGNTPPSFTSGRPGGPESGPIPERTTTSCSASRHSPLSIRYGCYPSISATEVLASGNTPPTFTPGRPGGPGSGPIPERTTTSCSASRHSPLSIRYGCYPSISATEVLASGNTPPSFTSGRPGGPESGPMIMASSNVC